MSGYNILNGTRVYENQGRLNNPCASPWCDGPADDETILSFVTVYDDGELSEPWEMCEDCAIYYRLPFQHNEAADLLRARLSAVEAERDALRAECERLRVALESIKRLSDCRATTRPALRGKLSAIYEQALAALATGEEMTE